jgi:integrase
VEEGQFFITYIHGKKQDVRIFVRADGAPWGKSNQQPRIAEALRVAHIERHVRFHDLRHTFGSVLANRGVPLEIIQKQLGHSSVRVTEQFYVHFSPSYVAAGVRAYKPSFGFVSVPEHAIEGMATPAATDGNVVPFRRSVAVRAT